MGDGFIAESITSVPSNPDGREVVELGPRMNFATAYSTNIVAICQTCGLEKVTRIERSRRYLLPAGVNRERFVREHHDRMTECLYDRPLETFETGMVPEPVFEIPLLEKGPNALLEIPGLAMDEWDRELYYHYFVKEEGRNPTIVEIRDLDNANSEHSRHGYFRGKQLIDGVAMPETLMEIVKSTLRANPSNSIIAFKDNSSGMRGYDCWTIIPEQPGKPTPFKKQKVHYHIIFTAETHNFPTGVAPFPGAETGTGGRIRDVQATGRGGLVLAGTAGYCVANLLIPGYDLPWEDKDAVYPSSLASPLDIEIKASDGASDYGNKFGEPVILGFTRSFDQKVQSGERWAWIKPIMFTGGIGQIDATHVEKEDAKTGMLIVQVGGPAYGIGLSGGSASSKLQGDQEAELDFNAVQRGDAEMEQKMNRVIRACIEMREANPMVSIHDQGAGGPANVLKELVEKAGGRIELRQIKLGDPTLSVLMIWIAEYQERCGFLILPERIEEFKSICEREKVNCEILGNVTGDGRFVVHDANDDSTPVNLNLAKVLGNMPQKTFKDKRMEPSLKPLELPKDGIHRGCVVSCASQPCRRVKEISYQQGRPECHRVDCAATMLWPPSIDCWRCGSDRPKPFRIDRGSHFDWRAADQDAHPSGGRGPDGGGRGAHQYRVGADQSIGRYQVFGQLDVGAQTSRRRCGPLRCGRRDARFDDPDGDCGGWWERQSFHGDSHWRRHRQISPGTG